MKVFPGSHASHLFQEWVAKYSNLGNLISPGQSSNPKIPYCLDNGVFTSWTHQIPWDGEKFKKHLIRHSEKKEKADWVVVPDVVGDWGKTLKLWDEWADTVSGFGAKLAVAVQDGATVATVPRSADVIFVGGSTMWKWQTARTWCESFPRVHIARVNSWRRLWDCKLWGAESCDGTGWFRGVEERHDLHLFSIVQAGLLPGIEQKINLPSLSPKARLAILSAFKEGTEPWNLQCLPLFKDTNI